MTGPDPANEPDWSGWPVPPDAELREYTPAQIEDALIRIGGLIEQYSRLKVQYYEWLRDRELEHDNLRAEAYGASAETMHRAREYEAARDPLVRKAARALKDADVAYKRVSIALDRANSDQMRMANINNNKTTEYLGARGVGR